MERIDLGTEKLPLFRQYAVTLTERINRGVYVEKLPSEPELVVESSLSRGTVRAALAILEAKGLITRFSGRGTFVNKQSLLFPKEEVGQVEIVPQLGSCREHPFVGTLLRLTAFFENTAISETAKSGLIKVINAQIGLVEQLETGSNT